MGYFYYEGILEQQNIKNALFLFTNSKTPFGDYYLFRHRIESGEKISVFDYTNFECNIDKTADGAAYVAKLIREKRYKGSLSISRDRLINILTGQYIPEGFLERGIDYFENKKYEEAYKDLSYAYERGLKEASIYLSKLLKQGLGCEKDIEKAKLLSQQAEDVNSIYFKAKDLIKQKKYEEGIELLSSIIDKHSDAKFELAKRYLYGDKVEKNEKLGYKLILELDKNIKEYFYEYLKCIYYGLGTKKDYNLFEQKTKYYILESRYNADKLDKEIDYIIGEAYYKGNGYKKDLKKAKQFLEYSKKAGYSKAKNLLEEVEKEISVIEKENSLRKQKTC